MEINLRLPYLVTVMTILLASFTSLTSARHTPTSNGRLHTNALNKRDVFMVPRLQIRGMGTGGLAMHCKLHPRNCPPGYMMEKKNRLESTMSQSRNEFSLPQATSSSQFSSFQNRQHPTVRELIQRVQEMSGLARPSDDRRQSINGLINLLLTSQRRPREMYNLQDSAV